MSRQRREHPISIAIERQHARIKRINFEHGFKYKPRHRRINKLTEYDWFMEEERMRQEQYYAIGQSLM